MTLLNGANPLIETLSNSATFVGGTGSSHAVDMLNLKEGQTLFSEKEIPRGLYFLKSGAVKLVASRPVTRGRMAAPEFITKIVSPGEFFGFKAVIKGEASGVSAIALRDSEAQIFSKGHIDSIMHGPASLIRSLLLQFARDLESFETNSQLHYLASVHERIAYQLVLLADKFGVPTDGGTLISLKLSRNELAQLAGTINESLSRHLTELKNAGLIELRGKDVLVKDRNALAAQSGNFQF